MIIVVDLGNSRLKWNALAYAHGGYLYKTQSEPWTEQALTGLFQSQWFQLGNDIDTMLVSNVAGAGIGDKLSKWTELNLRQTPNFVQTSISYNHIKNGYQEPKTLGVDRWLAVIAAHYQFPAYNVIVVDCGTATTVDAITADGRHIAGPIIPGANIMSNALLQFTAEIVFENQGSNDIPDTVNNTRDAVFQGAKLASVHGARQAVVNMAKQLVEAGNSNNNDAMAQIKVVVTGGRAGDLLPELQSFDCVHSPDLVLNGLSIMAKDTATR